MSSDIKEQWPRLLLGFVLLSYWFGSSIMNDWLIILGILTALMTIVSKEWIFSLATMLPLLVGWLLNPITVPNHHFLLMFLNLSYGLSWTLPQSESSVRRVLIVLFLFATVQKLLSDDFRNGSYFTWMLITNKFGHGFLLNDAFPWSAQLIANQEKIRVPTISPILLSVPPFFGLFGKCMSWMTICIEGLIAISWLNYERLKPLRILTLLFIVILPFIRAEFCFVGALCAGFAFCEQNESRTQIYLYFGASITTLYFFYTVYSLFL